MVVSVRGDKNKSVSRNYILVICYLLKSALISSYFNFKQQFFLEVSQLCIRINVINPPI